MIGWLLVVVIGIGLVAASVLCILHVVGEFAFNVQLGDLYYQLCVVGLLLVSEHGQVGLNDLVLIHT